MPHGKQSSGMQRRSKHSNTTTSSRIYTGTTIMGCFDQMSSEPERFRALFAFRHICCVYTKPFLLSYIQNFFFVRPPRNAVITGIFPSTSIHFRFKIIRIWEEPAYRYGARSIQFGNASLPKRYGSSCFAIKNGTSSIQNRHYFPTNPDSQNVWNQPSKQRSIQKWNEDPYKMGTKRYGT